MHLKISILFNGRENTSEILTQFIKHAQNKDLIDQVHSDLPFDNSISEHNEVPYPGDWELEEKIRHFIRWNALVTVLKANKDLDLGRPYINIFICCNII